MKKYFFFIGIILLAYCKKKSDEPKAFPVNYSCYSEKGKFLFHYIDKQSVWHSDTIYISNYSTTIELTEDQLWYDASIKSVLPYSTDSMKISAQYNGKSIFSAYRSNAGIPFEVSVQPSQAK